MTAEQAELNLRVRASNGVNRDSIEELRQLLRGRGWVTARELQRLRPAWNDRFIRALASAAGNTIISGPGSPGYCLASEIPDEQLEHAGRSRISQGRKMVHDGISFLRLLGLRRKVHQEETGK